MAQISRSKSHKSKSFSQNEAKQTLEFLISSIKQLHKATQNLAEKFPERRFTLDGRLLGDIGEVYANLIYDIALDTKQRARIDAVAGDGKTVQIKITMREQILFPKKSHADYFIGLRITPSYEIVEVYNGPSQKILKTRSKSKEKENGVYYISTRILEKLSSQVPTSQKLTYRH